MRKICIVAITDHRSTDKIKVDPEEMNIKGAKNIKMDDKIIVVSKRVGEFIEKYSKNG